MNLSQRSGGSTYLTQAALRYGFSRRFELLYSHHRIQMRIRHAFALFRQWSHQLQEVNYLRQSLHSLSCAIPGLASQMQGFLEDDVSNSDSDLGVYEQPRRRMMGSLLYLVAV
jgi:hypothetical protein